MAALCDQRPAAIPPDAATRRCILSAFLCGASPRRRKPRDPLPPPPPPPPAATRPSAGGRPLSELFATEPSSGEAAAVAALARDCPHRDAAAAEVRRRAKVDPAARTRLAAAGAVAMLVAMVVPPAGELQVEVLYALLNLGIGNDKNKLAIVEAGALERILVLIDSNPSPPVSEAIVANLLSLSALDCNKPLIGSSIAVPFLIAVLQNHKKQQMEHDSLRTLFNLSICSSNAPYLISHNLVPTLLSSLDGTDLSDRSLAILSNLVSSPEGLLALSRCPDIYPTLVDMLNSMDSPECQEKCVYILMIMVHKAGASDRVAMLDAGIVSSLLEVMLVGSALAQKRAARILDCLRVEKGKQVSEGFEARGLWKEVGGDEVEDGAMSEERRAVKELVRQSLQSNMRRILGRANLQYNFAPSERFLVMAGRSRSLPL